MSIYLMFLSVGQAIECVSFLDLLSLRILQSALFQSCIYIRNDCSQLVAHQIDCFAMSVFILDILASGLPAKLDVHTVISRQQPKSLPHQGQKNNLFSLPSNHRR